jgi:hypothetical protein
MKKASRPGGMTKPAQKRPAQKKLVTKSAKPKKAQDGARLAEVVTQLALSAEKLAQAADRLAEATARLPVIGVAHHDSLETPGQSTTDSITAQQESEAADATDGE